MSKTALQKYDRIEATGLWRPSRDAQRRDVIVSIGEATLTITDTQDRPLAHWSLPAVARQNPGQRPAIYAPDGDPGETLELADGEDEMVDAIEKLRSALHRRRPRPGRLRLVTLGSLALGIAALAVFWLPDALRNHAVSVVPDAKRAEIGTSLQSHLIHLTGKPCSSLLATPALGKLATRLDVPNLVVVRDGVRDTATLPGGTILMNRAIVEDFEEPDVAAGFILAQKAESREHDALRQLLEHAGIGATFRLLTTGSLPDGALRAYAEALVLLPHSTPPTEDLLALFSEKQVKSTPYAFALDPSGENTIDLIEADPFVTTPEPVLTDGDWVALQGICDS